MSRQYSWRAHFGVLFFSVLDFVLKGFLCILEYSNQIQKKAALRGMAALQREQPSQAADQAHLVNPLMAALPDWFPVAVVYLPHKEFNLVSSIKRQLFLVLLRALAMIPCGASSSSLSGNNW